nr:MAG: hypothetical protein DIU78_01945 [Pseudomonadota bacterium]
MLLGLGAVLLGKPAVAAGQSEIPATAESARGEESRTRIEASTSPSERELVRTSAVGAEQSSDRFSAGAVLDGELRSRDRVRTQAGEHEGRADEQMQVVPTITVTGRAPRPLTASTTRVTAREIEAVPKRNAEDVLRLVPGLTVVQHGSEGKGHQFFLRGFDALHGTDLELTVEGIPVNEWSNVHGQGYIDLGFVVPEAIESVDVTKGPFTLEQGAFAMAGSANYRLGISEEDRGVRVAYLVGTTNRHRGLVTLSPRESDGKDFFALEALHDDGFGRNRDVDRGAALGRVRLVDSPRYGTLALLGAASLAAFSLPGAVREEDVANGRLGFYDAYDAAGRGRSGRALAALSHELRETVHELKTTLYVGYRRLDLLENFTGFLLDPIHGDRRRQRESTWSLGATIAHAVRLGERMVLETGAGVRGDVLDQSSAHVGLDEALLASHRSLDGVQTLSHARLGLEWRPIDSLRLAAGARADVAHVAVRDRVSGGRSAGTLAAVSPRATAEWQAAPGLRCFAAYGRGFRPPEARAFTAHAPERTGFSENGADGGVAAMTTADALELGARYTPHRAFGAQLSGFAMAIERESVFDHVSGINLELGGTRRLGGEIVLRSRPLDWLLLVGDATLVHARFVRSGNPVPLAPWLTGSVRALVTHESGLFSGLRLMGLAPRTLPHGARGAPLSVLDVTLGYRLGSLRLDVEIENLLDQRIREGEYHYASHFRPGELPSQIPTVHIVAGPPRNARLGLSAVF